MKGILKYDIAYFKNTPPATNNFYRAWRSPKKVLMQISKKFCADCKYVNLKIELLQIFEKKSFSSLFLTRKPLSSDQKWFLMPYFPLIRGMFVFRSGLRFRVEHWKCPNREWGKGHFSKLISESGLFLTLGSFGKKQPRLRRILLTCPVQCHRWSSVKMQM